MKSSAQIDFMRAGPANSAVIGTLQTCKGSNDLDGNAEALNVAEPYDRKMVNDLQMAGRRILGPVR
jgi:hypothetical protein